jgi:sulfonate transport system permease protein
MKNRTAISAGAVMLFLIVWEIAPRLHLVNPVYTSQPSRVAAAAVEVVRNGSLPRDVAVSASEFAAGFALAVVIGVPLGLLLGVSRPLRYLIDPPIMALYATPYLALLPILVVWLGIGLASELDVFVKVILPGSLPGVLSGIRLGLSRAVLAVVIAEMYVSQAGLGSQIIRYGAAFRIDALLVYVLLVSAFGFLATRLVQIAEDRIPR